MAAARTADQWRAVATTIAGVPALHAALWARVLAGLRGGSPFTAEQSWATLVTWHDAGGVRPWMIGDLLAVPLRSAPRQLMLLAGPGAQLAARDHAPLAACLASFDVRFLPPPTAALVRPIAEACGAAVREAPGDSDHLLSVAAIARLERWSGSHGKRMRRFDRELAGVATLREGRLADPWAAAHLAATLDRWTAAKYGSLAAAPLAVRDERAGIERWHRELDPRTVRLFCLEVRGEPAGVAAVEVHRAARTVVGVVFKTDPALSAMGTAEALRRHVARATLAELGSRAVWNVQQDDDLPALRAAKRSWGATAVLPKFLVCAPEIRPSTPTRPSAAPTSPTSPCSS